MPIAIPTIGSLPTQFQVQGPAPAPVVAPAHGTPEPILPPTPSPPASPIRHRIFQPNTGQRFHSGLHCAKKTSPAALGQQTTYPGEGRSPLKSSKLTFWGHRSAPKAPTLRVRTMSEPTGAKRWDNGLFENSGQSVGHGTPHNR